MPILEEKINKARKNVAAVEFVNKPEAFIKVLLIYYIFLMFYYKRGQFFLH